DRRLCALLTLVLLEILELLARCVDLEDGGEVDVGGRAALASAVRATLHHRGGAADDGRRSVELAGGAHGRLRKAHHEYDEDDTGRDKGLHGLAPFQCVARTVRVHQFTV